MTRERDIKRTKTSDVEFKGGREEHSPKQETV